MHIVSKIIVFNLSRCVVIVSNPDISLNLPRTENCCWCRMLTVRNNPPYQILEWVMFSSHAKDPTFHSCHLHNCRDCNPAAEGQGYGLVKGVYIASLLCQWIGFILILSSSRDFVMLYSWECGTAWPWLPITNKSLQRKHDHTFLPY